MTCGPGVREVRATSCMTRFLLLAGASEMERNLTLERTRSAMAVKRANGQRVGAMPYGFDLASNGTTLVANGAEQAVDASSRGEDHLASAYPLEQGTRATANTGAEDVDHP